MLHKLLSYIRFNAGSGFAWLACKVSGACLVAIGSSSLADRGSVQVTVRSFAAGPTSVILILRDKTDRMLGDPNGGFQKALHEELAQVAKEKNG